MAAFPLRGSTIIVSVGLNRALLLKTRASDKSHCVFRSKMGGGGLACEPVQYRVRDFFTARSRVFSFHIDQAFVFAPGHSCINDAHMN